MEEKTKKSATQHDIRCSIETIELQAENKTGETNKHKRCTKTVEQRNTKLVKSKTDSIATGKEGKKQNKLNIW